MMGIFLFSCQNGAENTSHSAKNSLKKSPDKNSTKDLSKNKEKPTALSRKNAVGFLQKFSKENREIDAVIATPFGEIKIRLYENTPLHRASFVYLAKQDYFDGTWFHRVSPEHVIQAGNNDERATVNKRTQLGDYRIPAELEAGHLHQKYAVAAARRYDGNSGKESFPYEFYIVLGKRYEPRQLELLGEKEGMEFSQQQKNFYSQNAGSPHLDGEHTVFGIVTEGREIVDKIAQVESDQGEWPLKNIPIKVEVF